MPSSDRTKEKPVYYPALDGVRAISVFFVMFEHVTVHPSLLNHFHGWLGVDIFFVLSGFLITGLLLREDQRNGIVDMTSFYVRRVFRILPLYWFVLAIYILMLQPAAQHQKWGQMRIALPYFLTFNNELPLLLMPLKVGTVFGLSWTLGIEEKFYILWPLLAFVLLKTVRRRMLSAWIVYGATLLLAVFQFKMGRAYSGLIVGAMVALLLAGPHGVRLRAAVKKIPAWAVVLLVISGFVLVDLNVRFVFAFSWIIALMMSSLLVKASWLSRGLANPVLVWLGKRSYAMYLVQGFAMQTLHKKMQPQNAQQEVAYTMACFVLAALGASVLRVCIEEPARRMGKALLARRKSNKVAPEMRELPVLGPALFRGASLPNESS